MESKNFIQAFYDWYRSTLRHTKYRWLVIAGTLLYLFSPIDISPDFIPVVGWLDDGLIVTLLVTEMSQVLMEQMKLRSRRAATGESAEDEVMDTPSVIDVEVG